MDGLYITRKRKKWKFHHFDQWTNCWQSDEIKKSQVQDFVGKRKLTVEIGAGTADFSVELARRYPNECFIACDIKSDRLYTGAKTAMAEKLDNIRFMRLHINQLLDVIPPNIADTIWITFPDPFPRKRSAKHRLTHPGFLQLYKRILKPDGLLLFKTDNQKLFDWSLEQFAGERWKSQVIERDLHQSALSDDYKINTVFEKRFMNQGQPIYMSSIKP